MKKALLSVIFNGYLIHLHFLLSDFGSIILMLETGNKRYFDLLRLE